MEFLEMVGGLLFLGIIFVVIGTICSYIVDYFGILGLVGIGIFGIALLLKIADCISTSTMSVASIIAAAFVIVGTIMAAKKREREEKEERDRNNLS